TGIRTEYVGASVVNNDLRLQVVTLDGSGATVPLKNVSAKYVNIATKEEVAVTVSAVSGNARSFYYTVGTEAISKGEYELVIDQNGSNMPVWTYTLTSKNYTLGNGKTAEIKSVNNTRLRVVIK
ncbi:hypothetical protein, partial [Culicoidibacter larvae]|uniref:hypothetical protein n=1 Tax=Culicoidibacter larvae TaxID=2579976 RepID=UPI001A7E04CE